MAPRTLLLRFTLPESERASTYICHLITTHTRLSAGRSVLSTRCIYMDGAQDDDDEQEKEKEYMII